MTMTILIGMVAFAGVAVIVALSSTRHDPRRRRADGADGTSDGWEGGSSGDCSSDSAGGDCGGGDGGD